MIRIRLRPRQWAEFVHYKRRCPPWIKLPCAVLDRAAWHSLPDVAKALAPMLWLIASDSEQGLIDETLEDLAFRVRWDEGKLTAALEPLIEHGFFEQDATASGSRLPEDWRPGPDDRTFALRHGQNPDAVAKAFCSYWHAVPGAEGQKADWSATWRDWILRDALEPCGLPHEALRQS